MNWFTLPLPVTYFQVNSRGICCTSFLSSLCREILENPLRDKNMLSPPPLLSLSPVTPWRRLPTIQRSSKACVGTQGLLSSPTINWGRTVCKISIFFPSLLYDGKDAKPLIVAYSTIECVSSTLLALKLPYRQRSFLTVRKERIFFLIFLLFLLSWEQQSVHNYSLQGQFPTLFLRTIIIYLTLINNLQTITFLTIIYGPFSYFMRTIINIFIQYFRWNFFKECVFYFILAFYRTCFCFN